MRVNKDKQWLLRKKTPPRTLTITSSIDDELIHKRIIRNKQEEEKSKLSEDEKNYKEANELFNNINKVTKDSYDKVNSNIISLNNSFKSASLNKDVTNKETLINPKIKQNSITQPDGNNQISIDPALEFIVKVLEIEHLLNNFLIMKITFNDFLLLSTYNMESLGFNFVEINRTKFFIDKFLSFSKEKTLEEIMNFLELFPYFNKSINYYRSLYQKINNHNSQSQLLTANFITEGNNLSKNSSYKKNLCKKDNEVKSAPTGNLLLIENREIKEEKSEKSLIEIKNSQSFIIDTDKLNEEEQSKVNLSMEGNEQKGSFNNIKQQEDSMKKLINKNIEEGSKRNEHCIKITKSKFTPKLNKLKTDNLKINNKIEKYLNDRKEFSCKVIPKFDIVTKLKSSNEQENQFETITITST